MHLQFNLLQGCHCKNFCIAFAGIFLLPQRTLRKMRKEHYDFDTGKFSYLKSCKRVMIILRSLRESLYCLCGYISLPQRTLRKMRKEL